MSENGKREDDGGGFLAPPVAVMLAPVDIKHLIASNHWDYEHQDTRILNALKKALGETP